MRSMNSITRGLVSVFEYLPKLPALSIVGKALAASKRTELVTLYACALKDKFARSVIFQVFRMETSMPKYPGPRRLLRSPASPGNGKRQVPSFPVWPRMNVPGSIPVPHFNEAKIFGSPSQSVKTPVLGLAPCRTPKPFNSQLVGKSKPFCTMKGRPLDQRARPENAQPPAIASTARFQFCP